MKKTITSAAENTSSFINSFLPAFMSSRDRITAKQDKDRARQKLSDIFGGQPLPEVLAGMENVPLDQATTLAPLFGSQYGGMYKTQMATQGAQKVQQTGEHNIATENLTADQIKSAADKVALENEMDAKKLAEEQRANRVKESQIAKDLAFKEEKQNKLDMANYYDIAHDNSNGFKIRDTARANGDAIAKKLGLHVTQDGVYDKAQNRILRFLTGGADTNISTNTQNVPSVVSDLKQQGQQAVGVRPASVKKIIKTVPLSDGTTGYLYDDGSREVK